MKPDFTDDHSVEINLLQSAEEILQTAVRLERPFAQPIKDHEIRRALLRISKARQWLQDAQEATEDATERPEEENPYQELVDSLMSAAELLRASGALLPEFKEMREAGVHRARLLISLALAELCE